MTIEVAPSQSRLVLGYWCTLYNVDIIVAVAEDAVNDGKTEAPVDDVIEMSGRWSSRSDRSWPSTGRRHGPRAFSRRDTPRHVHIYKHDRGPTDKYLQCTVEFLGEFHYSCIMSSVPVTELPKIRHFYSVQRR